MIAHFAVMKTSNCIECGAPLAGRPDKKFCSENCKNKHWNRYYRLARECQARTYSALLANYGILEMLLKLSRTSIKLPELESLGFNTNVSSSHDKDSSGHSRHTCFDLSYCQSATKIFNLRRITPVKFP